MVGWLSYHNFEDQPWKLVETWDVDHVETTTDEIHAANRFSVSKSGAIGISCSEKPSLSVIDPATDKACLILSDDKIYSSATFVKIKDKEFLAAACREDGCLYMWDIESKASKKVFDPRLPNEQRYKHMNICKIDENTIGYGEVFESPDGSRRIFILKMDTAEEWSLSGTLAFFTGNIWHIFYTKMEDGAPCLLLCIPYNQLIMAVEMIGGKTRWEVGKEQMGEKFEPWSICTDDDNVVYVADFSQDMIHRLSPEDGSTISSVDLERHGIIAPFTVKFHDHCLYVEHDKYPHEKYAISKFKKNVRRQVELEEEVMKEMIIPKLPIRLK